MSEPAQRTTPQPDDRQALEALASSRDRIVAQIAKRVVGQREVVELLLVSLYAGGHALFVGVPGLAKTLLVSSLAEALELDFSRIQFTPDLMPSDITGSEVLEHDQETGARSFRFIAGPVFANLLLADEINRTPPKTQAALLQAMQESQVSAGGRTMPLPPPFHVFATQNPIEQEGTYPLPEAQLDRFMLEILVEYPDEQAEREIVGLGRRPLEPIEPVLSPAELIQHQALVQRLAVPESVVNYIVDLVRATRPESGTCPEGLRELIRWGAGPRAGQQLVAAAQARAALNGEQGVDVEDVRALATPVLRHRIVRSFAAESRGVSPTEIMAELLDSVQPNR